MSRIIALTAIVVWGVFAINCSPLKRAQRLINKAVANGAKVNRDTTYAPVQFTAPAMTFQTKLDKWKWGDTLYVRGVNGEARVITKIVQRPGKVERDTIIKVECPEQQVKTTTPIAVDTEISAGYTFWNLLFWFFVGLITGGSVVFVLKTLRII